MSDADFTSALLWTLTGEQIDAAGRDLHAALAENGWDQAAIRRHATAVIADGGVWPHPVSEELRRRFGSARLLAAVQRAQLDLGLFGEQAGPPAARSLNADERRLLQDVPPHHGS